MGVRSRRLSRHRLSRTRTAAGGFPTGWCGTSQRGDLPDPPGQTRRPVFKVIYAYPADLPGRFGYFADLLQSNASQIARFAAAQSDQRKTVRFDMGSTCGPRYLDIQVVALRRSRAEYLYESPSYPGVRYPYAGQAHLYAEVQAAIDGQTPYTTGFTAPVRNFLVFVDGLNLRMDREADGSWRTTPYNWDWGAATTYDDESADPYAQRNVNPYGQIATMYGSAPEAQPSGYPVEDPAQGFMPAEQLHELLHTLGAVQDGAPNSTGWLHCTDGQDVMCYQDSSDPRSTQRAVCPALSYGLFTQSIDCNRDDYFGPTPAAATYPATHWNTFDSPFLGSCRELLEACGGVDASTEADQVPFDVDRANAIWRRLYGGAGAGDAGSPIRVRMRSRQRVVRQRGVVARVRCRRACRVAVPRRVAVRLAGRAWRLRRERRAVAAGAAARITMRLGKSALRGLRREVAGGRRPLLRVALRVRDSAGAERRVVRRIRAI